MANKAKKAAVVAVVAGRKLAKVGRLATKAVPLTLEQVSLTRQFAAMAAQLHDTFQGKRDEQTQRDQVQAFVTYVTTDLISPWVKARFASKIAKILAAIKAGEVMGAGPLASKGKAGKKK